jgi:uncharacterized protein
LGLGKLEHKEAMMTPQERRLIDELFERLSTLEKVPRDQAAERTIADAMARAPNAIYPLVQAVLVQEEALVRANARIEELETASRGVTPNKDQSFLSDARGTFLGREQGSPGSMPSAAPRTNETIAPTQDIPMAQSNTGPSGAVPGGAFLGNAAATAVGVVGGSLLRDSFRSLFGRNAGSPAADKPKQSLWESNETKSDSGGKGGAGDLGDRSDIDPAGEHSAGDHDAGDSDSDEDYADDDDDYGDDDDADDDFDDGDED